MRQYHSIKTRYPHVLVLFRLGDFYELFYEDAIAASRELQITLTSRNRERGEPVPMCGVPYHAAEGYIARLLRAGYKIAVCDQMEQPGPGKKLVRREVVRVITPGTATSLNVLELKVDELVGAYAVTRLDDGERVVVAAEPGTSVGDEVRVAMRPEQVQLSPAAAASPDGGSFLRGRIAEVVFLGMYTQFHVDTRAGRVISHRMADEPLAELEPGADVVLEWQPEDAALV